ncbi:MAG TPA: thioredoxin-like domain-containing protein [Abditibacteriaceae bacterium]
MKSFSHSLFRWLGGAALLLTLVVASRAVRPVNSIPVAGAMMLQAPATSLEAPEFPNGATWLNTEKPLSLRALRGKIVLLDFWTYGCINCMHILPDLKKLERKYPNELVIVSVHTAKFRNEDESQNIRNAMLRYNIEHPVLVDKDQRVWDSYGVNAWPTLVLIDPAGRIAGSVAGEGNYDILDRSIAKISQQFSATGKLDKTPIKFALDAAKIQRTDLHYPGKVLADSALGRIFISDSNHNRIVITDMTGKTEAVAGSGQVGYKDGGFDEAQFHNPQGMALRGGTLYVADTGNHAVRALDLKTGMVKTIAGTGKQAAWRSTGGTGIRAALASPWDLLLQGDTLYIAMAGPHQIWRMNLKTTRVDVFAGSGREARLDGALNTAELAQPSGLATDGRSLFFADSESSSIRAADLLGAAQQKVTTLAGGGTVTSLFQFGDVDGSGETVRLQHPLGVAYGDGKLYIADTYNHKIKVYFPATEKTETLAGNGRGNRDGSDAQFYEPGGISLSGNKLFIADTNNHAIRVLDLRTKSVSTLQLQNVPSPLPAEPERAPKPKSAEDGTIVLDSQNIAANTRGELVLNLQLPAGHHLSVDAPQRFEARAEGNGLQLAANTVPSEKYKLPLQVGLKTGAIGGGSVIVSTTVFYCTDQNGLCKIKRLRFRVPFVVTPTDGARQLRIAVALP